MFWFSLFAVLLFLMFPKRFIKALFLAACTIAFAAYTLVVLVIGGLAITVEFVANAFKPSPFRR